jgi:hypothetical protein
MERGKTAEQGMKFAPGDSDSEWLDRARANAAKLLDLQLFEVHRSHSCGPNGRIESDPAPRANSAPVFTTRPALPNKAALPNKSTACSTSISVTTGITA